MTHLTSVDLQTEVLHRFVLELRYDFGHVYWDRAGRVVTSLIRNNPEWDFDQLSINTCQISSRRTNFVFNFGPDKLHLNQTQNAEVETLVTAEHFGAAAETLATEVIKILELTDFKRIGFRAWHLYPTSGRESSCERMKTLEVFNLASPVGMGFKSITDMNYVIVGDRGTHMLRATVTPFEQKVEIPESLIRQASIETRTLNTGQRKAFVDKLRAKKGN